MVAQVITGFSFEGRFGPLKTMILYFTSGLGGILFSVLFTDWPSVGASCAIYGMIGGFIAFYLVYWKLLNLPQQYKCMVIIIISLMVVVSFLVSIGQDVDLLGHIGGLFTGFFMLIILSAPIRGTITPYEKKWKIGASAFLGLFFLLGFILFYTVRDPLEPIYPY